MTGLAFVCTAQLLDTRVAKNEDARNDLDFDGPELCRRLSAVNLIALRNRYKLVLFMKNMAQLTHKT